MSSGREFQSGNALLKSLSSPQFVFDLIFLKLINNSSRENTENHYRDRGLDMWS